MSLVDLHIYGKIGEEGGGDITTESLSVTQNGTYTAPEGKAYTPVTVNVPQPSGSVTITENGTYDVTDKASAVVNVSGGAGPRIEYTVGSNNKVQVATALGFTTVPNTLFYGVKYPKIVFGNGTKVISPYSLGGITNVATDGTATEEIVFADSVEEFGDDMMNGSSCRLSSFTFPANLKKIGKSAFGNSSNIFMYVPHIVLPASLETVANRGLYNTSITEVKFLGKPASIDTGAFATSVADIYVPWAEGEVANAPWGATSATIHYNWTPTV